MFKIILPLLIVSSTIHAASPQYRITPVRNITEELRGDSDFKFIDFNDKGEMLMQHIVFMSRGTSPYSIVTNNNGEISQSFFGGRSIGVYALDNKGNWIGRGLGSSWISKSPQDEENDTSPTLSIFNAIGTSDTVVSIIVNDTEKDFRPLQINNNGQILGSLLHPTNPNVAISKAIATKTTEGWVVDDMNTILTLEGDTYVSKNIYLNDNRIIAGTSYRNASPSAFAANETNGHWNTTALGSLGGNTSSVSGLNNSGQIVGTSSLADNAGSHGFLATRAEDNSWNMVDLGTLGGLNSKATDINDAGQIIGTSEIEGQNYSSAVLISDGQAYKLIDLVTDQLAGWTKLTSAFKINNKGQIVGTGTYNSKQWNFILDPLITEHTPPVCEMGLDPQTINAGQGTALWWWSDSVVSASVNNGIGSVNTPSAFNWIYPTETTTYTMTATGADHSTTTCETTVIVDNSANTRPPICEMGADPQNIELGQGTALWWWSDNVISAKVDNGIGSINVPSDYTWFYPTETTTYKLIGKSEDGTETTCETTIGVYTD